MLKKSDLNRREFKDSELLPIGKIDKDSMELEIPDNLPQLLIWIADLSQYHHFVVIRLRNELESSAENEVHNRDEILNSLSFHNRKANTYNNIKDAYLRLLLNQDVVSVRGYITSPNNDAKKYAVIRYHDYDFVTLATSEIEQKFPVRILESFNPEKVKTLTEIGLDEESQNLINAFVTYYRGRCKWRINRNRAIHEHNIVAEKIRQRMRERQKALPTPPIKKASADEAPRQTIPEKAAQSSKKPITVIKKRKFTLAK
ncbi:hypothetical protein ACT43E_20830 (plasmid) [Acinetobacter baumannii]